jgi:hypothetical protein
MDANGGLLGGQGCKNAHMGLLQVIYLDIMDNLENGVTLW